MGTTRCWKWFFAIHFFRTALKISGPPTQSWWIKSGFYYIFFNTSMCVEVEETSVAEILLSFLNWVWRFKSVVTDPNSGRDVYFASLKHIKCVDCVTMDEAWLLSLLRSVDAGGLGIRLWLSWTFKYSKSHSLLCFNSFIHIKAYNFRRFYHL